MPEGKMLLGLSLYGFNESTARIQATGLSLKKVIRKTGRPVRLVPNTASELNSASVIHNKLTTPNGWELLFIKDGQQTHIAQTVKVQDIDAYARRDRERPYRDAKVGMLPPKLAQTIVNLATGPLPEQQLQNICDIPAGQPVPRQLLNQTVLDPFCGTGVVLQESLLMGYDAVGTDLDERMVDYSTKNLEWLREQFNQPLPGSNVTAGDATDTRWPSAPDFVACESYLGRAFTAMPTPEVLNQTITDCNLIIKKFLKNLHGQLNPGTRLCIGIPAWQIRDGQFRYLPLTDDVSNLGYEQVTFENLVSQTMLYHRPNQIVARQLLVLVQEISL